MRGSDNILNSHNLKFDLLKDIELFMYCMLSLSCFRGLFESGGSQYLGDGEQSTKKWMFGGEVGLKLLTFRPRLAGFTRLDILDQIG